MGLGMFDDGLETNVRPDKEDFLARARARLVGRKLVGIESKPVKVPGRPTEVEAFLIQFEGNEEMILFAPMAYGLSQSKQILGGQG